MGAVRRVARAQIDRGDVRGFRVGGAFGRAADDEHDDDVRTGGVYLIGHSRGGKISMLDAVEDSRVRAACLLDPVDNTVYAPLRGGLSALGGDARRSGRTARGGGRWYVRRGLRARGFELSGVSARGERGQLGGGDSRGALSVPRLRRIRAASGVRGGRRRRRAGAGTEPGAHGCARGDGVPRRPEGTRAAADVANDGGDVGKRSVRGVRESRRGELPWVVLKDGASRRAS